MSQLVEELVKPGQHKNLMSTLLLGWETTTTAELITMTPDMESGATPPIQINDGSYAMFQNVKQTMNSKQRQ